MNDFIKKETIEQLMSLENVVGVGLGLKQVNGISTGEKCVLVMVRQKLPETRLAAEQVVPKRVEDMVTDVVETGDFSINSIDSCFDLKYESDVISRLSRWRPAPGGVSIGHYLITAGTLGAIVYDRYTGRELILSNNHVLANSTTGVDGRARLCDPILQPGSADGGTIKFDTIAKLYRYVPLVEEGANLVDAALARPLRPDLVTPCILDIGIPQGVVQPRLEMGVKKSGRTTGLTCGFIVALNSTVSVNYDDDRTLLFENQILTTKISEPGDSGSLVVNKYNWAVGLLFADTPTVTLLNPINIVLEMLSVNLTNGMPE